MGNEIFLTLAWQVPPSLPRAIHSEVLSGIEWYATIAFIAVLSGTMSVFQWYHVAVFSDSLGAGGEGASHPTSDFELDGYKRAHILLAQSVCSLTTTPRVFLV